MCCLVFNDEDRSLVVRKKGKNKVGENLEVAPRHRAAAQMEALQPLSVHASRGSPLIPDGV